MNTKKMKKCFKTLEHDHKVSIALLVLRLIVGIAFVQHGWMKIQNPLAWMGPEAPVPGVFQLLAAISEFGGGMALIIGLLTPLACLGLAITMAVATFMHAVMMGDPFVSTGGSSYELALVFLGIFVLFMTTGPGQYSADAKVFGER